jgi:hypothetical protein
MPVLRLPYAFPLRFVASAKRYHRPTIFFVSPASLRQALINAGLDVYGLSSDGHPHQILFDGALRASQVPGESSRAFALLLFRPRSRLAAMPSRRLGFAPAGQTTKAATITISRLIHTASALAVYASRFGFPYTGKTRFRWVANPFRVGFEPTGLLRRISSRLRQPIYSNAPGFAWRH